MRFVVLGAGAVGGVVGGRLAQHGHDVVLIARGPHLEAIRRDGLRVVSADDDVVVHPPAAGTPAEVDWSADDVVLLATKSQHTVAALESLERHAPADVPVVCLQNGVSNEREALRRFAHVHGICVMLPSGHFDPGVVLAYSSPITGLLDVGRYPDGADDVDRAVAGALASSGFESVPRPDIMRWKHCKLLMNLGNAAEALCGPAARFGELADRIRIEGEAALAAAGIDVATTEEDADRRGDKLALRMIEGHRWGGGSSWQSLARGTGNVEADHLNGEVVLLGRLHDVPTPANALVQHLANALAATGAEPASMDEAEVIALLDQRAT